MEDGGEAREERKTDEDNGGGKGTEMVSDSSPRARHRDGTRSLSTLGRDTEEVAWSVQVYEHTLQWSEATGQGQPP